MPSPIFEQEKQWNSKCGHYEIDGVIESEGFRAIHWTKPDREMQPLGYWPSVELAMKACADHLTAWMDEEHRRK